MNAFLKDIFAQPGELKKVLKSLEEEYSEQVEKIALLINQAKEVVLTSMGSAYYSLMPMYYALSRRGYRVTLAESAELLRAREQLAREKLYILMSRSGESYEISRLPQILTEKGITSVGITMTPDSTMAKNVTHVLYDCASYDAMVCTKAYTSLALCGLRCVDMLKKSSPDLSGIREIEKMLDWMEAHKEEILEEIRRLDILKDVPDFYFLSRGYGMGVVKSGALWMEEVARKCVSVSSLDTFYHGPLELSRTDIIPVFLGVDLDARSDMILDRLCSFSDKVICFCPENMKHENSYTIFYPEFQVEPEYKMLLLAFYFQFLSYQCAFINGIEPGAMETISWVVK